MNKNKFCFLLIFMLSFSLSLLNSSSNYLLILSNYSFLTIPSIIYYAFTLLLFTYYNIINCQQWTIVYDPLIFYASIFKLLNDLVFLNIFIILSILSKHVIFINDNIIIIGVFTIMILFTDLLLIISNFIVHTNNSSYILNESDENNEIEI
jgi:hypothetical protein